MSAENVWGSRIDGQMTLEETIAHAERLLYALAIELRRIPAEAGSTHAEPRRAPPGSAQQSWSRSSSAPARTRALHVRALELKRDVARWRHSPPTEAERERVFGELEELTREAHECRAVRRASREILPRRFVSSVAAVARPAR